MFKIEITMIIIFFILLASGAHATNLGSIVKNNFAEISNSESARFTILFWNAENESYKMTLSVKDAPENWITIIDPSEFDLNKSTGEEYIALPYTDDKIKAKIVNILLKPDNSETGKYFFTIKAEARLNDNTNGVSIIPVKLFEFEVNINGTEKSKEVENKENRVEVSGNNIKHVSENLEIIEKTKSNKEYFYLFIIFILILSSIVIYKKYNR